VGSPELRLYYGHKEISFDEPELFAFGEALAMQTRFEAGDATRWGGGYNWSQVESLLDHLIEQGVLVHADDETGAPELPDRMVRPSPLPPSLCAEARTWNECEAITSELTGQAVELGYLELIVPVFRIAHIAFDTDGRQVGEANVFPRALRLDIPTTWLTCSYPGTRYLSDRPMNVTALKVMRLHWRQMMAALLQIRSAYLRRFPDAATEWTVGRVERLAALVLSVPTYQLARLDRPVESGQLHPVLSSLFRVTDGLRMTMHQMLFVPIGEPTLSPDDRLTSEQIFDYAERNFSFYSETGVCGGPKHMIQEFLSVLVDGRCPEGVEAVALDAPVVEALADVEAAFDYGLLGLRAHAALFSLWPDMARTYARVAELVDRAAADGLHVFDAFQQRMARRVQAMRTATYLSTEPWRVHREQVYADMYDQCARGLSLPRETPGLRADLEGMRTVDEAAGQALQQSLARRFGSASTSAPHVEAIGACLLAFFSHEQAVIRAACAVQQHINALLGRAAPTRPFGSRDVNVHNRFQGDDPRRLPYLLDELGEALGLDVTIDAERIAVSDRHHMTA
jgi:hypothetical protein